MGEPGPLVALLVSIVTVIYGLTKLKMIRDILVVLVFLGLGAMAMETVPALRVEPLYSMLTAFLDNLPEYLGDIFGYFNRLLGAVK
jgi:hypothetical protein